MIINEEEKLFNLLNRAEREERQEEDRVLNPDAVKRQLFLDEIAAAPIGNLDSDNDEDHILADEEDKESEQFGDEEEVLVNVGPEYTGKNGVTKRNAHCLRINMHTPTANLVRSLPGVRQNAWRLLSLINF